MKTNPALQRYYDFPIGTVKALLFVIPLLLSFGCVTKKQFVYTTTPKIQTTHTEFFDVTLRPQCFTTCYSFDIEIKNISEDVIEVLWDKSFYLLKGEQNGTFSFPNTAYSSQEKKKLLPPESIAPKSSLSQRILPDSLVYFPGGAVGDWKHLNMPEGENGILLTIKKGDDEIPEKITVTISYESVQ